TNTDAQDISTDNNPGNITIQNGSTLNLNVDDADANATNEIQDLDLTGDILTITNNAAPTNIDLSGYTNTDAQDISTDNNPGNITIQNGSTLNLNVDDADANATNEIQDLDLTGDILTITNNAAPTNIDLSGYTNTDAQDLSITQNTLSISGGATTIDLAIKPITPLSVDDTLDNTHYTVILNAGISNLAFPAAGANLGRIYIIKNISGGPVSTDNYQDLFNATLNSIANNTTITIQSDGTSWQQIN
uniref:hypothetical protein n=1 Tax=Flagellimonas flava TaxID=570519 RepID=UPI003D646A53